MLTGGRTMNRILLFCASPVYKRILTEVFAHLAPHAELCFLSDASQLQQAMKDAYDLVILDLGLPFMNPCLPVAQFLQNNPTARVIFLGERRRLGVLPPDWNEACADRVGVLSKPLKESFDENRRILRRDIRVELLKAARASGEETAEPPKAQSGYDLLLIASSTGGPSALDQVVSGFTRELEQPILIVQHMPQGFTANLAATLGRNYRGGATEAKEGDSLQGGRIYLAPGGRHMRIGAEQQIVLSDDEPVNGVRPSADVLFWSVAEQFAGKRILALVLTGMGVDGMSGVKMLKQRCQCTCIAQNEESSVVFGMPRAVIEAGLADRICDLKNIAGTIERLLSGTATG